MPAEGPRCQAHGTTNSPGGFPRLLVREKTRPARPLQPHFREEVRPARHKTPILSHFSCAGRTFSRSHPHQAKQGELFRARTHTRPSKAKNIAHRTQKHGDGETNNTTARPQQGTAETAITTAPTNCTKNAHFSPTKAMAVSTPHRYQRAKATGASENRATWSVGPGHGARGRRRSLTKLQMAGRRYKRRQTNAI